MVNVSYRALEGSLRKKLKIFINKSSLLNKLLVTNRAGEIL